MKNESRADQLQFLRFIAFTLIFLLHGSVWNFLELPVKSGAIEAVSFFFILSGVVTGYSSYEKEMTPTLKNVFEYMKRKLCKVYPLYIVTTLFTIIYTQIPQLISTHQFKTLIKGLGIQLLKNVLLLQSWFPTGYFSFNGVGWFLSTIIFLYLFNVPVIYILNKVNKSKYRYLYFTGSFVILILLIITYCYIMRNHNAEFWMYVFPPARIGEYFCGIIMGCVTRSIKLHNQIQGERRTLFTYMEIGALIFWLGASFSATGTWQFRIVQWLLPNIIVLVVFTFGNGWISKLFSCKLLKWLGDISFECFLLHQIVENLYAKLNGGSISRMGDLFALAFCMVITVVFATLLRGKEEGRK